MPAPLTPRRPGRPKAADANVIQDHIVAVAQQLFFEHGVTATGMEAVAKAAGITKQTLYARFANKDELYRAVIEDVMRRWREQQGPLLGDCTSLEEALYRHTVQTLETASREGSALLMRFLNAEPGQDAQSARMIMAPLREKGISDIETILAAFADPPGQSAAGQRAAAEFYFTCLASRINDISTFPDECGPAAHATWARLAVGIFLNGYRTVI